MNDESTVEETPVADPSDPSGSESSGIPESTEPTVFEVPYTTVQLPSGELIVRQEITLGDSLVSFAILVACLLFIAKWLWEGLK